MLFWWEEELMRWRVLEEEIAELEGVLAAVGEEERDGEVGVALRVARAKMGVWPSLRGARAVEGTVLPGYYGPSAS
jgi:hypothetical protein